MINGQSDRDPERAGEPVEFAANGPTAGGYLAVPASGSGPGVLVIQEWWGLVSSWSKHAIMGYYLSIDTRCLWALVKSEVFQ